MTSTPLRSVAIQMAQDDDVAVALRGLDAGLVIDLGKGRGTITVTANIPRGHKLALTRVPVGAPVSKYGQSIGRATSEIHPGDHVHSHNLGMDDSEHEHGKERLRARQEPGPPVGPIPTFAGYRRANGTVGTRNYIGVLTSVNCSATAALMIAEAFKYQALTEYPNVDGVMALTHQSGCGLITGSEGAETLLRTLRGYARHPNFGGLVVLGLGCEMVAVESLVDDGTIPADTIVSSLTIQAAGGVRAAVAEGIARVKEMLPALDARRREDTPVSELVLGLNCGGSDGFSGVSANPALGVASDRLVSCGGTSILAETPEIFGAEHLLTYRAADPDVARRLLSRLQWWQRYAAQGGGSLDNNPSPGNKDGGLTTILEKSLGAVAKGGQAELSAVYEYADPVTSRGLVFMDTPGYDPVSVTGIIAGGATVICFTTGRGSVFGSKPAPSIKIATNTELFQRMGDDIDVNAGSIVDGSASLDDVGNEIFELIIRVASGQRTASEDLGIGDQEFVPWTFGTVT
ncbi:UxaA family hydrolase [Humibacter ginsenosidimutans]|uniref:Altronate dehydratase n=1 Tax=Humibacter ginsenosidimutans TaxID=2599293 RepID=A0A5B8M1N8_9MICO|nr:altronate dehydratase family protein [Humibacter ginsenosidimutans]QDZ14186.1 altronate dehydratase [Humibacter ginsenosidimutans]